ncbi:MAG: general secretion pathway protein GspB [Rubrivivax sp.]
MSYVLDALRRADAERRRGGLPDLHAQPVSIDAASATATPASGRPGSWLLGALAATVLLAGVGGWLWVQRDAAPAAGPGAGSPMSATGVAGGVAIAPIDALRAPSSSMPPMPRSQPVPPRPVTPRPAAGPLARSSLLDPEPTGPASPTTTLSAPTPTTTPTPSPTPSPTTTPTTTPAAPVPGAPPAGERVPTLASLPPALRQQLPPLAFGGATDSTSAAARMLIVNGQVAREGDEIAPGLVLERIMLRSARMRWRGQRFEVAY